VPWAAFVVDRLWPCVEALYGQACGARNRPAQDRRWVTRFVIFFTSLLSNYSRRVTKRQLAPQDLNIGQGVLAFEGGACSTPRPMVGICLVAVRLLRPLQSTAAELPGRFACQPD